MSGSLPGLGLIQRDRLPQSGGLNVPFGSQRGVKMSIECGRNGSAQEMSLSPPPYCCGRHFCPPSREANPSLSPVLSDSNGPRPATAAPAKFTVDSELMLPPGGK